ncbi:MAG: PrgI family protein [Patescibacteria group bacterium]|nr:PrgI family protein [Patescibacteria group bacterium]
MENHPIPQDVTGFKFKLIGDMTVKQFAFLAGGVGLAFLFFYAPIFWLIKYSISLFSALLGVSLAFLPIEGRPLDIMFGNFLRALFSPNQYVYQKLGGQLLVPIVIQKIQGPAKQTQAQSQNKLQMYLANLPQKPKEKHDEKEMMFFKSLSSMLSGGMAQPTVSQPPGGPPRIILTDEEKKSREAGSGSARKEEKPIISQPKNQQNLNEVLQKEAALITKELEEAKKEEAIQKEPAVTANIHQKVLELEQQLNEVMTERNQFEQQLLNLKKTIETQQQKVFTPGAIQPKAETQNVRTIPKTMGKTVGAPITPDVPNLITGIVKDARGNVLPGILIEVKDKEGNPVRAFKTNGLGQFASATPLLNGTYTVAFEDPKGKNKFDVIELIVSGEIISPLEVISSDEREELRKALFSSAAGN